MKNKEIVLIKLGGSLITHKRNKKSIEEYLSVIEKFRSNEGTLEDLTKSISQLLNKEIIIEIFRHIFTYTQRNPSTKVLIVHGAGSIGHSLVLNLLKQEENLNNVYQVIKLAVAIQNQLVVSLAIQSGIKAISLPVHQLMVGYPTKKPSTNRLDAPNLSVFETLLENTDSVPVFYGDVGYSNNQQLELKGGWKVFSGDLIPGALSRGLTNNQIKRAIFITQVEGRETGIYTKDPDETDAELISRIRVSNKTIEYFNNFGQTLKFQQSNSFSNFDVTGAMEGKLRNIVELANQGTKTWVVGLHDFPGALQGESGGTRIEPKDELDTKVVFLGIGDAFSSGGKKSAGILIDYPSNGKKLLLDCGPHTLQALKSSKIITSSIDWILISHFHGDHINGIPYLLLELSFQTKRTKPLKIIGPSGIEEQVNQLFSALYKNEATKTLPFKLTFHEVSPTTPFKEENIRISAFSMNHTPEALGYRITSNYDKKIRTIAYTGDTGWTENLIPLIKNSQLAILECNYYNTEFLTHLNWSEIKKLIQHAERISITHLGAEMHRYLFSLDEIRGLLIPLEGQTIRI
ncbi:MAG: amino acid kinase family protein [Candidatus Hodarchaeales archaeon]